MKEAEMAQIKDGGKIKRIKIGKQYEEISSIDSREDGMELDELITKLGGKRPILETSENGKRSRTFITPDGRGYFTVETIVRIRKSREHEVSCSEEMRADVEQLLHDKFFEHGWIW